MEKDQAENYIRGELSKGRTQEEISAVLCQELGAPPELVNNFVSKVANEEPEPAMSYAANPIKLPDPPLVEELPEIETSFNPIPEEVLEAEILKALGKNRKQSDVVVLVCEKTGMNWAQAQRMVARVATTHHKKLTARQNWLTIPLSIIAIIVGGALVAAAIAEDYEAARQINDVIQGNSSHVGDIEFAIRESLWALVTGSMLFVGGIGGLVVGLKKQFS